MAILPTTRIERTPQGAHSTNTLAVRGHGNAVSSHAIRRRALFAKYPDSGGLVYTPGAIPKISNVTVAFDCTGILTWNRAILEKWLGEGV